MGGWAGAKPRARVGVGNLKKEGVLSILSRARPEQQAAVLRAVLGRLTPKKHGRPVPTTEHIGRGWAPEIKGSEKSSNFWRKNGKVKRPIKGDGARALNCWRFLECVKAKTQGGIWPLGYSEKSGVRIWFFIWGAARVGFPSSVCGNWAPGGAWPFVRWRRGGAVFKMVFEMCSGQTPPP